MEIPICYEQQLNDPGLPMGVCKLRPQSKEKSICGP